MRIIYTLSPHRSDNAYYRSINSVLVGFRCFLCFGPVEQLLKLFAVCGDQFLFKLTALYFYGHIVVISADEAATALKVGNSP